MKKGQIIAITAISAIAVGILSTVIYMYYHSFKRKLIRIAKQQADKWQNLGELSTGASAMLVEYWQSVGVHFTQSQMQSQSVQASYPWSSAFISYLFHKAGAKDRFPYASAHSTYFQYAKKNRNNKNAPLRGFRITEYAPKVGDIIVYTRQSGKGYDSSGFFPAHGELVIEKNNQSVKAIGGNVSNSVRISTYTLNPNGLLSTKEKAFFMVIQNNINS